MVNRKPLILCVDDEDNPLVLRKLVLEKAGYDVVTAHSADQALQVMDTRPIDLVVSDHLMPGLTGVELAQAMKTKHPKTPIILISGVNDIPTDADSADAFLSKVEGPDKLCREVAAVLNATFLRHPPASSETSL
jgi:DNA-binding NtrC family response regulator